MAKVTSADVSRAASRHDTRGIDIIAAICACVFLAWALIGESLSGTYGWAKFIPIAAIPALHLHRFTGLDMAKPLEKTGFSHVFFDKVYPVLAIVITFAAIPYFLAVSGVYVQDTGFHMVFTGEVEHAGIHHGYFGWYLIIEAMFYHRLNRHAIVNRNLGNAFQNGLVVMGIFLFLDDFWGEQITAGVLGWPDPFLFINRLLPFSWDTNFAIEIAGVAAVAFCIQWIFYCRRSQG
jgi:hypothetical protein